VSDTRNEHESTSRPEDRRFVTVLYADLSGYTALTLAFEPEYIVEVTNHLHRCGERVAARFGGMLYQQEGDGLYLVFGFPEPSVDDGRHAVEAALALHKEVDVASSVSAMPIQEKLVLHSGIDCGSVTAEGAVGARNYRLVGSVMALARKLSDDAGEGEILMTARTLGGESRFFATRRHRDVKVASGGEAVESLAVRQVLERTEKVITHYQARMAGKPTPFVGRAHELNLLHGVLRETVAGAMREVRVAAPPGLGKTRLVDQFLQGAVRLPLRVCRGFCESYLGAEPLQPFRQIVRALASHSGQSELAGALEACFPSSSATEHAPRHDAVTSLCDLFTAISERQPLVLFIDDWHWADDATRSVVERLSATKPPRTLLILASREPLAEVGESLGDCVIELRPFDAAETITAIERLVPNANPIDAETFEQRSGGNPLFLEELCHPSTRDEDRRKLRSGDSLPALISRLVRGRVSELPSSQSDIVRAAAVVGASIPAWLLAELTSRHREDPIFEELAAQDLLYPVDVMGNYRFKHGITRDVIYAWLGRAERRKRHGEIVKLIDKRMDERPDEPLVELLAYHLREAGDLARAAVCAEQAGESASDAGSADRARTQLTAALEMLETLRKSERDADARERHYRKWSRVLHKFGLACVFDPTPAQLEAFRHAVGLAQERHDSAGEARAEYWQGFLHYALSDSVEAVRHYELARACAARVRSDAPTTKEGAMLAAEMQALDVQIVAALGEVRAATRDHREAIALIDEAVAVKRRYRRGSRAAVGSAYSLACKGAVLGDLGEFDRAYECFAEAREAIVAEHPAIEGSVFGLHSAVCLWHGRWEEGRALAASAQQRARRVGSLYVLAMCKSVEAYATWVLERTPASLDVIARSASWLEARGQGLYISLSYGWLADICASFGEDRRRDANQYATRAIRRAEVRDSFGEAASWRALAALPWHGSGRTPDECLEQALIAADKSGSARERAVTLLHIGQRAAAMGRVADANRSLEEARAFFNRSGMGWHDAIAALAFKSLEESRHADSPGYPRVDLHGERRAARD
jgi:class 3 adenylate cyclase/tetratricopeptide (TPR) repeat protein